MFRLVTIALALALAGMGEASLLIERNSLDGWFESDAPILESSFQAQPDGNGEADFNDNFLEAAVSGEEDASPELENQIDAMPEGESADSGLNTDGLIHLMINGQVNHVVQMH